MNNQDMQEQFKAEIIKNDYFLRVCRIKGIEPYEILSLHTDGQFKYSDTRLAYGAWLTKAFELQKKDKQIENISLLVISLRNEFDLHGGGDQVERQLELLEEFFRGTKNK